MELKERYIYAVASKLPEKQRKEIENEVRMLIDDMMEDAFGYSEDEKLTNVLNQLGDPSKLAQKYQDNNRYLIGPNYFHKYLYVLRLVIMISLITASVNAILEMLFSNFTDAITNYFSFLISSIFYSFTIVTIIFAIFEYTKINLDNKNWTLNDLPQIPDKKATISRGEAIFGIIFATAFLFLIYSEYFGIIIKSNNDELTLVPFFNYDNLAHFKTIIIILSLIGIAKDVLKLLYGRWNMHLALINSILSIIGTIIFVIVFSNLKVWNLNFINEIALILDIDISKYTIPYKKTINIIVFIGIFISVIDIIITLFKGNKYKHK